MLSETLHSLKVLITFETLEPPDNRVFLLAVGVERLLMLEADAADDALVRFLLALTAPEADFLRASSIELFENV